MVPAVLGGEHQQLDVVLQSKPHEDLEPLTGCTAELLDGCVVILREPEHGTVDVRIGSVDEDEAHGQDHLPRRYVELVISITVRPGRQRAALRQAFPTTTPTPWAMVLRVLAAGCEMEMATQSRNVLYLNR